MSKDSKHPDFTSLAVDIADLKAKRLTPEQKKTATKLRPGALAALQRILDLKPEQLEAAGISLTEITRVTGLLGEYKYAEELLGPANNIAELVYETKVDRGHQIACFLGEVAGQVRRRVQRNILDQEVLAAIEEVLDYQYGPAYKARLTRVKKAKAEQPAPQQPAPQQPDAKSLAN